MGDFLLYLLPDDVKENDCFDESVAQNLNICGDLKLLCRVELNGSLIEHN